MTELYFHDPNPGGSKTILFLHGLGADSTSWIPQFDVLSRADLRPIAVDMPGFGNSPYDGKGWALRRVAADLSAALSGLGINRFCLAGLSLGGLVAQRFVLDFPERVESLVLISTFAVLRPENLSQWGYFLQRIIVVHLLGLPAQARIVAGRVFPDPGQEALRYMAEEKIASANPRAYRAAMRSLGLVNFSGRLSEIDLPTLVISGADDTTVSPKRQKVLVDGIRNARHVVIPDAGHAVNLDQPDRFNKVLLEFLSNT